MMRTLLLLTFLWASVAGAYTPFNWAIQSDTTTPHTGGVPLPAHCSFNWVTQPYQVSGVDANNQTCSGTNCLLMSVSSQYQPMISADLNCDNEAQAGVDRSVVIDLYVPDDGQYHTLKIEPGSNGDMSLGPEQTNCAEGGLLILVNEAGDLIDKTGITKKICRKPSFLPNQQGLNYPFDLPGMDYTTQCLGCTGYQPWMVEVPAGAVLQIEVKQVVQMKGNVPVTTFTSIGSTITFSLQSRPQ